MEITCNTASGILVIQPILKLIVFFVCTAKSYEQTKLLLINLSVLPLLYKIIVSRDLETNLIIAQTALGESFKDCLTFKVHKMVKCQSNKVAFDLFAFLNAFDG